MNIELIVGILYSVAFVGLAVFLTLRIRKKYMAVILASSCLPFSALTGFSDDASLCGKAGEFTAAFLFFYVVIAAVYVVFFNKKTVEIDASKNDS